MAREGLDERAAFERLRGYARSTRQQLKPVAAELIKGQPLPAPAPSGKPKRRRQRSH
jgi:AmiR/NasT family two-component response regulator